MRVLHCIPTFLGGGAERQLAYLCEGLSARGVSVHVVLLTDGPHGARARAAGATLHALGHRGTYDPSILWELCGLIRTVDPQVVQTWLPRMDLWGGLAARAMKRPWVYSERSSARLPLTWQESVRRRVIAHASAVVANSETGAQPWRQRLGGRVPVQVIPNALPMDEVRHAPALDRARLDLPPDAEVVLYVGRFTPEKNIPMLSEVLLRTLEIRPRAVALCCGEGPQLDRFRAQVAARGMAQRCRTLGYRRDVWSIMKLSDVFLSTSEIEGRPNAVVEAMGSGCQLVLSDIPQHREVVTAEAGLFFPRNDANRAVERLCEALDATGEARGARAAAAGRAVEQFSVARMAEAYEALYQSLAQDGGPA